MRHLTASLVAAGALVLTGAAPAAAATYCVDDPACPAGGIAQPTVGDATTAATASSDADVVRVGPGRFDLPSPSALVVGQDVLQGAGAGQTTLVGVVELQGRPGLRDLTVELAPLQETGVSAVGGTITGVAIDGPAGTAAGAVGFAGDSRTTFSEGTITMAAGTGAYGAGVGSPLVADSTITAPTGVRASYYGIDVARTHITATTGVSAPDGDAQLDAVLIDLVGAGATGVVIGPGDVTPFASSARHLTVRGAGTGVAVLGRCEFQRATLTVDASVIATTGTALRRAAACPQAGQQPAPANLTVTRSAFDPAAVVSTGPGTASIQAPVTPAPALDADGVPPAGSPLIDAGDPAEAAATDLRGLVRPFDGDGDGTAVADLGAFEVQPTPGDGDGEEEGEGGIGGGGSESGGSDPVAPPAPPVTTPQPPADGAVAGEVDRRLAPARPRITVARRKGQPRRFVVTVRIAAPKGTSARGGTVALDVWARKRNLGVRRATVDRRGRATFVLRLPKGVKRRQVGVRATFAGTRTLTRRTGGWSGLS